MIKQFGTLEKLYQEISKSEIRNECLKAKQIQNEENTKKLAEKLKISEKLLKILKENKEQAFLSYKLSKIATNVPMEFNLSDAKIHDYDQQKVIALFNKLGFKSLISRLPESHRPNNQSTLF